MHKLIIFAGPSGSGKTTLVRYLLKNNPDLNFSISATTRKKRHNEEHGKDYYFISEEEFLKKIKHNEFVEWEEVYQGGYYGTIKSEIERIWALNKNVIFDVDVEGALNIKKIYGEKALAVFVMPPSIEQLKLRLNARATETVYDLKRRIEKAKQELNYANQFDKVVVNNNLETSLREAQQIKDEFIGYPQNG